MARDQNLTALLLTLAVHAAVWLLASGYPFQHVSPAQALANCLRQLPGYSGEAEIASDQRLKVGASTPFLTDALKPIPNKHGKKNQGLGPGFFDQRACNCKRTRRG